MMPTRKFPERVGADHSDALFRFWEGKPGSLPAAAEINGRALQMPHFQTPGADPGAGHGAEPSHNFRKGHGVPVEVIGWSKAAPLQLGNQFPGIQSKGTILAARRGLSIPIFSAILSIMASTLRLFWGTPYSGSNCGFCGTRHAHLPG